MRLFELIHNAIQDRDDHNCISYKRVGSAKSWNNFFAVLELEKYKLELGRGLQQPGYQLYLRLNQETGEQVKIRSKDMLGRRGVEKVACLF